MHFASEKRNAADINYILLIHIEDGFCSFFVNFSSYGSVIDDESGVLNSPFFIVSSGREHQDSIVRLGGCMGIQTQVNYNL